MNKIRTAVFSALISISALSLSANAEPAVTTTIPVGTTAVTQTSVSTTEEAVITTQIGTPLEGLSGSIVVSSDKLKSGEFYNEVMEYVGDENAANLNDNLKNNALAINSTTIDYNDKSMFTVTTRSGDVFYIIINNSDGTCLFLNSVDTADLTSLLNKSSGNAVSMNEDAVSDIEKIEKEQSSTEEQGNTILMKKKPHLPLPTKKVLTGKAILFG